MSDNSDHTEKECTEEVEGNYPARLDCGYHQDDAGEESIEGVDALRDSQQVGRSRSTIASLFAEVDEVICHSNLSTNVTEL